MKLLRTMSCLLAMLDIHGSSLAQNPVIQTHLSPALPAWCIKEDNSVLK